MHNNDPLLKIRFDGKAVGPSKIPVTHLLRFLTSMNKALLRTGRVMTGGGQKTCAGDRSHAASRRKWRSTWCC